MRVCIHACVRVHVLPPPPSPCVPPPPTYTPTHTHTHNPAVRLPCACACRSNTCVLQDTRNVRAWAEPPPPPPPPNRPTARQARNYIVAAVDAESFAECKRFRLPCYDATNDFTSLEAGARSEVMVINTDACERGFRVKPLNPKHRSV